MPSRLVRDQPRRDNIATRSLCPRTWETLSGADNRKRNTKKAYSLTKRSTPTARTEWRALPFRRGSPGGTAKMRPPKADAQLSYCHCSFRLYFLSPDASISPWWIPTVPHNRCRILSRAEAHAARAIRYVKKPRCEPVRRPAWPRESQPRYDQMFVADRLVASSSAK